ncbi:unnamed protein product [Spodoptera exigua]|nr:unnamed protein product [Spodoptera exigua]
MISFTELSEINQQSSERSEEIRAVDEAEVQVIPGCSICIEHSHRLVANVTLRLHQLTATELPQDSTERGKELENWMSN